MHYIFLDNQHKDYPTVLLSDTCRKRMSIDIFCCGLDPLTGEYPTDTMIYPDAAVSKDQRSQARLVGGLLWQLCTHACERTHAQHILRVLTVGSHALTLWHAQSHTQARQHTGLRARPPVERNLFCRTITRLRCDPPCTRARTTHLTRANCW